MAKSEEFKIKTKVELDTKDAQRKFDDFVKSNKDKKKIELKVSIKDFDKLGNSLDNIKSKLNNSLTIDSKVLSDVEKLNNNFKELKDSVNAVSKAYNLLNKSGAITSNKSGIISTTQDEKNIKSLKRELKELYKDRNNLLKIKQSGIGSDIDFKDIDAKLNKIEKRASDIKKGLELAGISEIEVIDLNNINKGISLADELKRKVNAIQSNTKYRNLDKSEYSVKELNKLIKEFESKELTDISLEDIDKLSKGLKEVKRIQDALDFEIDLKSNQKRRLSEYKKILDEKAKYQKALDSGLFSQKEEESVLAKIRSLNKAEQDIKRDLRENYKLNPSDIFDDKLINKSTKAMSNYEKVLNDIKSSDVYKNKPYSAEFDEIKKIEDAYKKISKKSITQTNDFDISKINEYTNKLKEYYKVVKANEKLGKLSFEIDKMQFPDKYLDDLEKLQSKLNAKNMLSIPEIKGVEETIQKLKILQKQIQDFENLKIKFPEITGTEEIQQIEQQFERAMKSIATGVDEISFRELSNQGRDFGEFSANLKKMDDGFLSVRRNARDFYDEITSYTIGEAIGEFAVDSIRELASSYLELDKSMANIRKVADPFDVDSWSELENIRSQAVDIAKDVGMASSDVQNSIADALQAGIGSMKESIEVAKQSMILANVGDMGQEQATASVNSMIAGFNLKPLKEVEVQVGNTTRKTNELTNAMDMLNWAGNNYAIGSDGVAEAIKRGGTVLAQYGVSLSDTVALITSANEAIQDPARVGNGLKSIAINFAGIKANARTGTLELNKSAKALNEIAGIDVFKDKKKGELKTMVELLDEVQGVWDKLSDSEQKGLSEALAGKTQASVFQSLMNNYETFKQMQTEFAEGQHFGSAEKENEQYVNSLSGKLNALKETWLDTFTTIMNSQFTYGLLDGLNAISEAINNIVHAVDSSGLGLTSIFSLFGMGKGIKSSLTNSLGKTQNNLSDFLESLTFTQTSDGIFKIGQAVDDTSKKAVKANMSIKDSVKGLKNTYKEAGGGIKGLGKTISSTFSLEVSDGLKGALKNIGGSMLMGAGVGLATTLGMEALNALDEYKRRYEIIDEKSKERISGIQSEISQYKNQKTALKGIAKEYDNLASKADRTVAEQERYQELTKQIAEIMPELVVGTDAQGNPIISMSGDVSDLIARLDDAIDRKTKLLQSEQSRSALNSFQLAKDNKFEFDDESFNYSMKKRALDRNMLTKEYDEVWFGGYKRRLQAQAKYNQEELALLEEHNAQVALLEEQRAEINNTIAQRAFNELQNNNKYSNYQNATDNIKNQINSLMAGINWSGLSGVGEQNRVIGIMDDISAKAKSGSVDISKYAKAIQDAETELKSGGSYNDYKKKIEGISKRLTDSSKDADTLTRAILLQEGAYQVADKALGNFLRNQNSSYSNYMNNDKQARKLREQFRAVEDAYFEAQATIEAGGDITKDFVMNFIVNNDDMPKEIKDLANTFLSPDSQGGSSLTDLEKTVLMSVITKVNTTGEDPQKAIDEALDNYGLSPDGTMTINAFAVVNIIPKLGEGISKIGDMIKNFFNGGDETANALKGYRLDITPEGVEFHDEKVTEEAKQKAKESAEKTGNAVKEVFDSSFKGSRALYQTIVNSGIEGKEQLGYLREALESVPSEKRIEFVNNFADAFKDAESLEEALNSLSDADKLIYNVQITGDKDLSEIQNKINSLSAEKKQVFIDFITSNPDMVGYLKGMSSEHAEKIIDIMVNDNSASEKILNIMNQLNEMGATDYQISAVLEYIIKTGEVPDSLSQIKDEKVQKIVNFVTKGEDKVEKASKEAGKPVEKNIEIKPTTTQDSKGNTIGKIDTSSAERALDRLNKKLQSFDGQSYKSVVTVATETARKNMTGLQNKLKQWNKKTFHASLIAHTAHAYSKLSALLNKVKQWSGKTFHASFIAHTAHAYSKVTALVSRASAWSGRTFHASMTVTKTVVEKTESDKPKKQNLSIERTISDAPMPLDNSNNVQPLAEPQAVAESPKTRASSPSIEDVIKAGSDKTLFSDWISQIGKATSQAVGEVQKKTKTLADVLKKGVTVTITSITTATKDLVDALKYDIDIFKELENSIKQVSNQIDRLDKRLEHSVGSNRIANLKAQNEELEKRIKLNEELIKGYKKQRDAYKQTLQKQGLKFTAEGNISNYEETMLKYKRELEKLDETSEKQSEAEQKRNEKRKKQLEEIIQMMEKYMELVFDIIPSTEFETSDDKNQIKDNELEIKQIEYEKWVVKWESAWKDLNKEVQKLTNQLEMLDIQMEYAFGKDKVDLMNKQLSLLKQQQTAYQQNIGLMKDAQLDVQNKLMEYGFKFNSNGDIEDFVATMNKLKDTSEEFDTIQDLVDGYFDLYLEQIPEAERELAQFENQIKDIYKSQLEATKEVEDTIIKMYKKQIEEKKELIQDELDAKLDALKKEQEAYERMREDQKYEDDYNEQADKVAELQKQIEYAKKDSTLAGQKRLKDLMKQLEEEQKALDKITQDRIDDQVDNAFKDEEDRLQDTADKEIEDLEDKYTDEKLLEMAQEAIKNGIFVGIDGEVQNLQDALIDYMNKWEEGLSATGVLIKEEMITNLEIANELVKNYADTIAGLGMGSFDDNEIYNNATSGKTYNGTPQVQSINYHQPLVYVQGNVDSDNIDDIRKIAEDVVKRNNEKILGKI